MKAGIMTKAVSEKPNPFINYPSNKLFAVISHPDDLQITVDALSDLGVNETAIETFCGDAGIKRIDAKGHEHGLHSRIIRGLQQLGQEGSDVTYYEKELAAGHYLISVSTLNNELKMQVVEILKAHGGRHISFYGPMSIENF